MRRFLPTLTLLLLLLSLGLLSGCADDGSPTARIADFAAVSGVVFLDLDRSGSRAGDDPALPGARVSLGFLGGQGDLRTREADAEGRFLAGDLPPGQLVLTVDGDVLGDSLEFSGQQPHPLILSVPDTVEVQLAVSFPIRGAEEALASPTGTRLFVEGVALAGPGTLPGSQVHLRGSGGQPVRTVVSGPPGFEAGDSIRVLGRIAQTPFGPRLEGGRLVVVGSGPEPSPIQVTAAEARSALAGAAEGDLVRISTAQVTQASVSDGIAGIRLADASGNVDARILLPHLAEAGLPVPMAGTRHHVTGVLVPAPSVAGGWTVRTRGGGDLVALDQGTLEGRVFLDVSDTGTFDPADGDAVAASAVVRIRPAGVPGADDQEVVTDPDGRFRLEGLPAGRWEATVDPLTIPPGWVDEVMDPDPVDVQPSGTAAITIRFGLATS